MTEYYATNLVSIYHINFSDTCYQFDCASRTESTITPHASSFSFTTIVMPTTFLQKLSIAMPVSVIEERIIKFPTGETKTMKIEYTIKDFQVVEKNSSDGNSLGYLVKGIGYSIHTNII
jgi:hypothetical protein